MFCVQAIETASGYLPRARSHNAAADLRLLRSIRPSARRPPGRSVGIRRMAKRMAVNQEPCRAEKTRCCLSGPGHEVLAISTCPPSSPVRASRWVALPAAGLPRCRPPGHRARPPTPPAATGPSPRGRGLPFGQDATELARRDIDAQLVQLLPQQRLGDVLMVVLVEDEAEQVGPEVAAGDNPGGQGGDQGLAVWGQPAFAAIADDAGLDDQILDNEIFIALEGRPGRLVDEADRHPRSVMVNSAVLDLLSDPGRFRPGADGIGAAFRGDWERARGEFSAP